MYLWKTALLGFILSTTREMIYLETQNYYGDSKSQQYFTCWNRPITDRLVHISRMCDSYRLDYVLELELEFIQNGAVKVLRLLET